MKIGDAVVLISEHVRQAKTSVADAVRSHWADIQPLEDTDALVVEGLARRVGEYLRNPVIDGSTAAYELAVAVETPIRPSYSVSVALVYDTQYTVNGKSKPVADFTLFDVRAKRNTTRLTEQGVVRHRELWDFIEELLVRFKKSKVSELGEGEQAKIARKLAAIKSFKFSPELKALVQ